MAHTLARPLIRLNGVQEEMERVDKEDWLLQDVIFVEDSRNIPVGKVLKVGLLQYVQ